MSEAHKQIEFPGLGRDVEADPRPVRDLTEEDLKELDHRTADLMLAVLGRYNEAVREAIGKADSRLAEAINENRAAVRLVAAFINSQGIPAMQSRLEELEARIEQLEAEKAERERETQRAAVSPVPRSLAEDLVDTAGMIWHQTKATILHPLTASTVEMYLDRVRGRDGRVRFRRRYKTIYGTPHADEGSANG